MSYSPPRRFAADIPSKLTGDPEARHAQEGLINAYEAEEERIINVLSRKLEKLREDKIDLENALEAESESHVNKLSRQLGSVRMEHEALKAKYEALAADRRRHGAERGEGSSSSAGPSSNGLERIHRRRKGASVLSSGGEKKKKKRSAGKSKDTASSNSTSTSNGKLNAKGKEKARSPSRSPPRPEAMSRSSTLTGLNTLLSTGLSVAEPSVDMMLAAMKRENEHLRNRLVDTERDYIRLSRTNEIYREELISHRRRLGLSIENLISNSPDPLSQPTHHRTQPPAHQNAYHSNMSSPSTSMYHIPTMNGSRHHDPGPPGHLNGMNGHAAQGSLLHQLQHQHQHGTHAGGTTSGGSKHPASSSSTSKSHAVQGVPIPRPASEDPYALGHPTTRRVRPKNIISSEGSTPLSRSPTSNDDDEDDDEDDDGAGINSDDDVEDDEELFSPGASGSASGAGSISPYPLFSPVASSHMHMAQYGYGARHSSGHSGSGRMRSTSGAGEYYNYPSSSMHSGGGGASYHNNNNNSSNNAGHGGGYGHYTPGAQPASYASVDTSATSPPSSGGGLGFGGGLGGFAGMMGMRGIGIPSLGAMAANARAHGGGIRRGGGGGSGGVGNTPIQRGLSYPSVPPPSLSSSLGSVSPSVPLYMHYRDRDRDREGGRDRDRDRDRDREWGEGSRDPSLSPVEPLSRRNSLGGPGGRRGSVGAGGRVAETGSLRSNTGMNSRRASFDYSYATFAAGPGVSSTSAISGMGGIPGSGPISGGGGGMTSGGGAGGFGIGGSGGGGGGGGATSPSFSGGTERVQVHPSGARVAESGSLMRSGGASGRSRAGSLTLSSGVAGYTAGYGYYLPETVDEGEGGEDGFGGSSAMGAGAEVVAGADVAGENRGRKDEDESLDLEEEVVGGLELGPVPIVKKTGNS